MADGNGHKIDEPAPIATRHTRPERARWWYLALVPCYVGLLYVPIYAREDPELFGFPFFYWYQFAWVPLTALLTWVAYRKVG